MSNQETALNILIITAWQDLAKYIKDNLGIMIEYQKGIIEGILWSMFALNYITGEERRDIHRYLDTL